MAPGSFLGFTCCLLDLLQHSPASFFFFTLISPIVLNADHSPASFFFCSGLQFAKEEVRWPGEQGFLKAWGPCQQFDGQAVQFLWFNSYECFPGCESTARKWWWRTGSGRRRMRFVIILKSCHFNSLQPRPFFFFWLMQHSFVLLLLLFTCSLESRSSDGPTMRRGAQHVKLHSAIHLTHFWTAAVLHHQWQLKLHSSKCSLCVYKGEKKVSIYLTGQRNIIFILRWRLSPTCRAVIGIFNGSTITQTVWVQEHTQRTQIW